MNWLDIVLLILVVGSVVSAFAKGLTRELVGFVTVIAALVVSIWFYGTVGGYLLPYVKSRSVANLCGFLIAFFGIMLIGGLVGQIMKRIMKVAGLSFFDRALGAIFGLVRGVLVSIALVMAAMAFTPGDGAPRAVVESRLAPYVIDAARGCAAIAPYELRQGFRRSYEEVKGIWVTLSARGFKHCQAKRKRIMKEKFESLVEHLIGNGFFLEEAVEILEKTLIQRALAQTGGNRSAASKLLGIHRNTLQRKLMDYQLVQRPKPARAERSVRRRTKAG